MWTCPRCSRAFKAENQQHYCGQPPETIDAYIAEQDEAVIPYLTQVRDTLRAVLPDAQERISWRMPTYWNGHNLIHFAAGKKHVGLYPGPAAVAAFADALAPYKTTKGAIQFPYKDPLPLTLIADIARWCVQTGNHA